MDHTDKTREEYMRDYRIRVKGILDYFSEIGLKLDEGMDDDMLDRLDLAMLSMYSLGVQDGIDGGPYQSVKELTQEM